jgi:signal peptidase II
MLNLVNPTKTSLKIGSVVAILAFIDQFIKYKIRSAGGFYICNYGISLGILPNKGLFLILGFFILILCAFIWIYSKKLKEFNIFTIALALILSGALANLTDRIYQGCVVDYLHITLLNMPYFNFADMLITLGALIFISSFKK